MSSGYAGDNFKHILTLGNSIIGVSVLAMPFCFKQCGLVLGILLLFFSSYINRLNCHFLIKSAIYTKRRSYEFLAFQIFGAIGKFAIEVVQIGFLFGICVSFFVIAGDLGPTIVARALGISSDDNLRAWFLTVLCFAIVLPLCLLRNIDSLASLSAVSLTFYALLAVKIFSDSWPHIAAGSWLLRVRLWRPEGVLQALPIMSLALACQTNVFSIYDALPEPSLPRMNSVVAGAINLCCSVYVLVGFFGYVALSDRPFGGNLLNDLTPSPITRWINTGFVMSIALGFPLIIFPCRVSLNSLLYRRVSSVVDISSSHIPDLRFQCITFVILACSLLVGILVPSIEVVLGLLGSTMGTVIAILFPSAMFIRQQGRDNLEGISARACFVIGLLLLVCGTYVNLYAADQMTSAGGKMTFSDKELAVLMPVHAVNRSTVDSAGSGVLHNDSHVVRHEPANPQPPLSANSAEKSSGGADSLDPQAIAKHDEEVRAKHDEEAHAKNEDKLSLEKKQEKALHDLQLAQKEQKAILKELLQEVKDQKKLVAQGNPAILAASRDNKTVNGVVMQETGGLVQQQPVAVGGIAPHPQAAVPEIPAAQHPISGKSVGQSVPAQSTQHLQQQQGLALQNAAPAPQNIGQAPHHAAPVLQNVQAPQNVGQVPQYGAPVPQNFQAPQNAAPVFQNVQAPQNFGQVQQYGVPVPQNVQAPQNAAPVLQNVQAPQDVGQVQQYGAPVQQNVQAPQNVGQVPQYGVLVPQNVGQAPQNAAPIPQNVGQAPQNAPVPQNVDQAPQNAAPVTQNVGPAPQNAAPVPQNVAQAPQNAAPVPQNVAQAPQNAAPVPRNVGQAPQYVAPVPQNVGQAPQYVAPVPQNVGQAPQNAAPVPQNVAQAPQNAAPVPRNVGQAPQYVERQAPEYIGKNPEIPTNRGIDKSQHHVEFTKNLVNQNMQGRRKLEI